MVRIKDWAKTMTPEQNCKRCGVPANVHKVITETCELEELRDLAARAEYWINEAELDSRFGSAQESELRKWLADYKQIKGGQR